MQQLKRKSNPSKLGAIRNPDGIWINTNVFREPALHFQKHGYYCPDPWDSPAWREYWQAELNKTRNGYQVGGVRITGDHYFYLNYTRIKLSKVTNNNVAEKIESFPDFWDGDYNYFWSKDIARFGCTVKELEKLQLTVKPSLLYLEGGNHMIVAKSRRKGYSFKNAAVCANVYNNTRKSLVIIGAADKKFLYPNGTMSMTTNHLNFLNEHTGWKKNRDKLNKIDHIKASYISKVNGTEVEKGYQSEVIALTFKDNSDAARGKDAKIVLFEETGSFPNLEDSYLATEPTLRDGKLITGQILVFGCVCAGTKVWTHDGRQINIENLTQEDGIIGYAGNGVIQEPIVWMKPPAKKTCYRIETLKGNYIECSDDHPLLVSYNHNSVKGRKIVTFKKAKDIGIGDQLMMVKQIPIFGDKRIWNPRLIGLLIGDGNYTENNTPQLSTEGEDIYEWLKNSNEEITVYKQFITKAGLIYRSIGIRNTIGKLRWLGMYGQTWGNKKMPDNIYECDQYSIQELLGGYFDADGNVYYNPKKNSLKIVLTSKYIQLLEEVKTLLFKLNIGCNIVEEYRKGGFKAGLIYRLYINKVKDIEQFRKHIKFITKYKQAALDNFNMSNIKSRHSYDNCLFEINQDNNKGTFYLQDDNNHLNNLESCYVNWVECIGDKDVYNLNAGITHTYITNNFISGNTGGDMESGTVDFANMFYNPTTYHLMPFENIWDDNAEESNCGFFHPLYFNNVGFYDENGNSNIKAAIDYELEERAKMMKTSRGSDILNKHNQEYCLNPSEAFLTVSHNSFPVIELKARLDKINRENLHILYGQPGTLYRDDKGEVKFKVDLKKELEPIWYRIPKTKDITGAVVIYEYPCAYPPKGLYKVGYDPYAQNEGTSMGSIIVYKGVQRGSYTRDMIVAEYTGRPGEADDMNRAFEMLCELYHTEGMHENMVLHVKSYFTRRKKLHLLASQPDNVIGRTVKDSTVNRVYGIHMDDKLKDAGEKYIKQWLLTERDTDESGRVLSNIDFINSPGFIEELISYNRKNNFDRVMAYMMVMFQIEEEVLGKVYEDNTDEERKNKFDELIANFSRRN